MTQKELAALMKSTAGVIRDVVAPLEKRIEAIEAGEVRLQDIDNDIKDILTNLAVLKAELKESLKAIPEGPQGEKGEPGESVIGPQGPRGEKGDPGEAGPVGPQGPAGQDGAPGTPGERGERGLPGEKGDPGESIVGPAGQIGERGLDGKDGKDGRDGRDGVNGKDGRDGVNGRDAAELEILPRIETSKSFPRGTFARYEGGLIRAIRDTDAIGDSIAAAGWEVLVQGVAHHRIVQSESDPRVFVAESRLTGGTLSTAEFRIPAMCYAGVYKRDCEYVQGDTVTWGGSTWHCNVVKTTSTPGEGNSDWQLIVKRGRDGKSGKDAG